MDKQTEHFTQKVKKKDVKRTFYHKVFLNAIH